MSFSGPRLDPLHGRAAVARSGSRLRRFLFFPFHSTDQGSSNMADTFARAQGLAETHFTLIRSSERNIIDRIFENKKKNKKKQIFPGLPPCPRGSAFGPLQVFLSMDGKIFVRFSPFFLLSRSCEEKAVAFSS